MLRTFLFISVACAFCSSALRSQLLHFIASLRAAALVLLVTVFFLGAMAGLPLRNSSIAQGIDVNAWRKDV
jgi:hypothetical protein